MKAKFKIGEIPVVFCRDCQFSETDWKFENLSVDGKPTLLKCSIHTERKRIINEQGCNDYKSKSI